MPSGAEGIRIGVKKGGCAGMEYTVDLVREASPADDMVDVGGAKVFVNPQATLFLLGTEMDFEVTKLRTGFVFRNPNQTSACGCGESVEIRPASRTRWPRLAAERDFDWLHDLFEPVGPITIRRMFGGAGIYRDGIMFALVSDGEVYLKATIRQPTLPRRDAGRSSTRRTASRSTCPIGASRRGARRWRAAARRGRNSRTRRRSALKNRQEPRR